ncbi:hypothetical protein CJF31_00005240 [Rutstroemia sp. NJR-2017a BVV2]|nr:hypothetical protein CJF31_00005240 [Rutstroemia sp. NJR-2017a BVV2]
MAMQTPTSNETRACITPNASVGNTVFIVMPNTTTITLGSNTTYSPLPEFTPPFYCQNQTTNSNPTDSPALYTTKGPSDKTGPQTFSPVPLYSYAPEYTYQVPTTVIITSKNPVVVYTSNTPPSYPSTPKTSYISKVPVNPDGMVSQQNTPPRFPIDRTKETPHVAVPTNSDANPTQQSGQQNGGGGNGSSSPGEQNGGVSDQPDRNSGEPGNSNGNSGGPKSVTAIVSDVTVILAPSRVVINGQTIGGGSGGSQPTVVTQKGQVFTVYPSEVAGPGTFLVIPSAGAGNSGGGNVDSNNQSPNYENSGSGGSSGGGGGGGGTNGGGGISGGGGTSEINGGNGVGGGVGESNGEQGSGSGGYGGVNGGQGNSGGGYGGVNGPGSNGGGNDAGGYGGEGNNPGGSGNGVFVLAPSSTVIGSVTIQVGQSIAQINGASYTIGPGAPDKTTVVNQQTISIGAGGLAFPGTTLAPLPREPTNIMVLGGQPISVENSVAYIGSSTFTYGAGSATKTEVFNGETILIGPSGIGLAKTTLAGGSDSGLQLGIAGGLTLTEVGATLGIISGTTFTVGPGATSTVAVINGETISAGPSAIIGASTTLTYPLINPTHTVAIEGITFTEIGSSLAVFGRTTFTFGPGAAPTSYFHNGQTISIGGDGIGFASTTFTGIPQRPATQAITAGGITFSEIGSTLAVIDGTTFNFGPSAKPTSLTVNGQSISIGPGGIGFASTTFRGIAQTPTTQAITAGGITFSEVGSTLAVINGTTFTFGLGAQPTSHTFNGQTISIGPQGIGFATTTFTGTTNTKSGSAKSTSTSVRGQEDDNGVGILTPTFGILGACFLVGAGVII